MLSFHISWRNSCGLQLQLRPEGEWPNIHFTLPCPPPPPQLGLWPQTPVDLIQHLLADFSQLRIRRVVNAALPIAPETKFVVFQCHKFPMRSQKQWFQKYAKISWQVIQVIWVTPEVAHKKRFSLLIIWYKIVSWLQLWRYIWCWRICRVSSCDQERIVPKHGAADLRSRWSTQWIIIGWCRGW